MSGTFKSIKGALGCAAIAVALLSGCATPPTDPEDLADYQAVNDPLEPTNRAVFEFNRSVDGLFIKPLAKGYVWAVPDRGRLAVHNFLNNLRAPFTFANDVLQAEPKRAGVTVGRFVVNSTAGLLGFFDVAANYLDMPYHGEDAGQTFAVWGAPAGPYLMLPIFGPSNPRDTAGLAVEFLADPTDIALDATGISYLTWIRFGLDGIDTRAGLLDTLDDLERTSLDYYVTIRSVSRQRREDEINNSNPSSNTGAPSLTKSSPSDKQASR